MGTIFRNYKSPGKTKKSDVVKQQKPSVGVVPWVPNRQTSGLRQPHEKGTFFSAKATGSAADAAIPKNPSVIKLFPNNPVAVGTSVVQLMLDNANRDEFQVQNISTAHVALGFGKPPTISSYDFMLAPCAIAGDGQGGAYISDEFKGAVYAISDGVGSVSIKELPA
jgi:hypothetical protein